MATDFELLMHRDAQPGQIDEAVRALDWLESIENELTVYNPNSAIAMLNRRPAKQPLRVSAAVFDILQKSQQLSEMLDGAFDVTAGPLIEAWGFTNRSGKRPSEQQIAENREKVGWQFLSLDPTSQTVAFEREGMQLNLGAIGKGYALDRIATRLTAAGIQHFLLHGGNSSILAHGHADRSASQGWLVGLAHPIRSGARLGGVRLHNQALATSGSGKQFFHFQGKRFGHVIDPRTGWPTGDSLSLTVLANNATSADAVATGLYVLGLERVREFTEEYAQFQVLATVAGQRQGEVQVLKYNYSADL